mmetsp:Transcript_15166/g.24779  ORF Transcript_15166/g.24779 Transcript_15166/m.24779 type:complete len:90 (+) Transcript_15166:1493-1762(+)
MHRLANKDIKPRCHCHLGAPKGNNSSSSSQDLVNNQPLVSSLPNLLDSNKHISVKAILSDMAAIEATDILADRRLEDMTAIRNSRRALC